MKKNVSILIMFVMLLQLIPGGIQIYAAATIDTTSPYSGNYLLTYNSSTDVTTSGSTGTLPSIQTLNNFSNTYDVVSGSENQVEDVEVKDGEKYYQVKYKDNFKLDKSKFNTNTKYSKNTLLSQNPTTYSVGDTKTFICEDSYLSTPESTYTYNVPATVKYVGTYCTVFVEDANASVISTTNAQSVAHEFDTKIRDFMYNNYGEYVKNGDGKIVILIQDIRDENYHHVNSNYYIAGYFTPADYVDTQYGGNGNVLSMIHVDIFPLLCLTSNSTPDMSKSYSTITHEFQHMISFTDFWNSYPDQQEQNELWLDEAFSMAAEHMLYSPLNDKIQGFNGSTAVKNGSVLAFNDYGVNNNDFGANYGVAYLFGQYLRTQTLNKTGGGNAIFKKIWQSNYGDYRAVMQGLGSVLYSVTSFDELQRNFRLALLLKESSGLYGFAGDTAFSGVNYPLYTGTNATLLGTEAVIKSISSPFTPSGYGSSIKFVGVNSTGLTPSPSPSPTPTPSPMNVISSSPVDGATGVGINDNITLAYNQLITSLNSAGITIKKSDGTEVTRTAGFTDNKLIIGHTSPFEYNTTYTITVPSGCVTGQTGTVASNFSLSFTTVNQPNITFTDVVPPITTASTLESTDGLSPDGKYAKGYAFIGKAGQQLEVSESSSNIDCMLYLLDSNKEQIELNDNIDNTTTNSKISYSLPYTGQYYIIASENALMTGTFSINITLTDSPLMINSLYLGDESGTQLSSITAGQDIYICSNITGTAEAGNIVYAIYSNNVLIDILSSGYYGNATYGYYYELPSNVSEISAKVFLISDYGSIKPLTPNKSLQFNTYTILP